MGAALLAVVAEGDRRRLYLEPTPGHVQAAAVERPAEIPDQELGYDPRNLWTPQYGLTRFSDLFTNRQLVALTTFSDLVGEARERVLADALATGMPEGERLEAGGSDAAAYADAVAVYLGIVVSKMTDRNSTLVNWYVSRESTSSTFARQALPMMWDYCEVQPLGNNTGSFDNSLSWTAETIELLRGVVVARVSQQDASSRSYGGAVVSTDPPYYDNIGYSDLSDYFYVWLRASLRSVLPGNFATVLVPKAEELVANPYRHAGREGAKHFFESGFRNVFKRAREAASSEFPITVYYAFKQSDTHDDGESSSGWETLLDGMVRNGWQITSTWPIRSELSNRMIGSGTNALASSIVLSLRPRAENAPTTDRRGFITALQAELKGALETLQVGGIAPVDLPQAAIGPGMAVFSRYASVLESDGTPMTVRSALARINEVLDQVLNEQEGDFDSTTRFAIAWFKQHGYTSGSFGDADNLARARNTAVAALDRDEVLRSRAGQVALLAPSELRDDYDVVTDDHTSAWEVTHHLIRILEADGVTSAGAFLALAAPRADVEIDLVPELGHLLFRVCEDRGWTKEAIGFNSLVSIWPEILEASRAPQTRDQQTTFDFDDE